MNNMTRLNKKAFKILLTVMIISVISLIVNMAVSFATIDSQIAVQMESFAELNFEVDEAMIRSSAIPTLILTMLLGLTYYGLMIYFLLSHNKKPRKGRYLTVMLVLSIIALVIMPCALIFTLFNFDAFTFISGIFTVIILIVMIVGIRIHRNDPRPPSDDPQFIQSPYNL